MDCSGEFIMIIMVLTCGRDGQKNRSREMTVRPNQGFEYKDKDQRTWVASKAGEATLQLPERNIALRAS
jgi:hypothetical protein